jgi:hypothetical protein
MTRRTLRSTTVSAVAAGRPMRPRLPRVHEGRQVHRRPVPSLPGLLRRGLAQRGRFRQPGVQPPGRWSTLRPPVLPRRRASPHQA